MKMVIYVIGVSLFEKCNTNIFIPMSKKYINELIKRIFIFLKSIQFVLAEFVNKVYIIN